MEEWSDLVTVISCDMRKWQSTEKVGLCCVIVVCSGDDLYQFTEIPPSFLP